MQRPSNERMLLATLGAITSVVSTAFLIIRPVQLPTWLPGEAPAHSGAVRGAPATGGEADNAFSVTAGDGEIAITWPIANAMDHYSAQAMAEAGVPARMPCRAVAAPSDHSTRCVVSGLRNGISYLVSVSTTHDGDTTVPLRTMRAVPQPGLLSSPDVVAWYDASDYATIQTQQGKPAAIGSKVLALHDRSPHHGTVVQDQSARQPTVGQLGRRPALVLNGNEVLTADDRTYPDDDRPATVLVVAAQDDPNSTTTCFHNLLSWGTGKPLHARIIHKGCGTPLAFAESYGTWVEQRPTQAWPTGRAAVLSAVFLGEETSVRLDGTPSYRWGKTLDQSLQTESSGVMSFGGAAWDPQGGWQGRIGEVIVFARALHPREVQAMEDYLAAKWQVPIN